LDPKPRASHGSARRFFAEHRRFCAFALFLDYLLPCFQPRSPGKAAGLFPSTQEALLLVLGVRRLVANPAAGESRRAT